MARRMGPFAAKLSDGLDRLTQAVSPRWAYRRRAYRFAYDALDGHRTRKPRSLTGGPGDQHLTETALSRLREICRDMGRNNPIVKGLLATEAKGVVGSETKIEATTGDPGWNEAAETLWRENMVDAPCEVTGRFNVHKFLDLAYRSYRRDGDALVVFGDDSPWLVEGEQCGTPFGVADGQHFNVTNGVATRKSDGRVIGYYIGKPDKWGFIAAGGYTKYTADRVQHIWNPDRVSYTRGEPVLTPAIDWIDKLTRYADAELVAAHVNALFVMALTKRFPEGLLPSARPSAASTQTSEEGFKQEKLGAGLIYECAPGEEARAISAQRPAAQFDPFILRCLMFICRPMCLPLMLGTLDFGGATYMNARIAYQEAHDNWIDEQNLVVRPLVSRMWRWRIGRWIETGLLSDRPDAYSHRVGCKRWPYIDPYKEAMADKVDLENGTNTRTRICARRGVDYSDIVADRVREIETESEQGLAATPAAPEGESDDGTK